MESHWEPISKDLLYMKIADAIYNYIHTNELCPGAKIPSERALAKNLNTGRNSVREALRVLENQGIIEVKTGQGVFVRENTISGSIYFKLVKTNYLELLETKTVLEQKILEKVINNVPPEQYQQMEKHLTTLEAAAAKRVYSAADDLKFHKAMLDLSPNKTMTQIVDEIRKILDSYAMEFQGTLETWLSTVPYHRDLLEALKNRDLQKAYDAHNQIYKIDVSLFNKLANSENSADRQDCL